MTEDYDKADPAQVSDRLKTSGLSQTNWTNHRGQVSVIPCEDEEDAIGIANESSFGLSGAMFTNVSERAFQVARQVRTGTVSHNGPNADFSIGFGGFKQSGLGREGGIQGLLPYLESKTVLINDGPNAA